MKRGLFIFTGLLVVFLIGLTSAGYCTGRIQCEFLDGNEILCNALSHETICSWYGAEDLCEEGSSNNANSCDLFDWDEEGCEDYPYNCIWTPGCVTDDDCELEFGSNWECQGGGQSCTGTYRGTDEVDYDGVRYPDWDIIGWRAGDWYGDPTCNYDGDCDDAGNMGYIVESGIWYTAECVKEFAVWNFLFCNNVVPESRDFVRSGYASEPCSALTTETCTPSGCSIEDTYGSCVDTCTPWTNTQFCANIIGSNSCETVNANDNCGDPRVVNCGTCETWESCNNNVCETTSPLSNCEECTDNSQCASGSCQETLEFASTSRCVPVDYCPTDDASNCAISINDNLCYNDQLRSCGHEPTSGNFYTWNAEPYATITDCPLGCIDGEDVCLEAPSTYDTCENCIGGGHEWCDTDGGNDLCLFAGTTECVDGQGGNPISLEANCQDPITEYDNCETCLEDEENFWCSSSEEGDFCTGDEDYCSDDINDGGVEGTVLLSCEGLPGDPTPNPELLWTDLDGEDITGNTISMGVSTLPQSVNVVYQDTLLNMPQTFTILEYDLIGGYKEVGTVDATSDAENYLNGTLTIDLALLSAAGNEARYEFYFEINGTRSEILRINTDELPVTHWKDSQGNDYAENNRYDLDRDYLISNSITLQMYYLNGDGTETFDLYANGHYIDSYDSSLVASSAYDWAPTCEQLSAIGANEQNFDFYFETAAEPNPSATLEVRFDEAIPDSCQLAEEEILFDVNVCSDYPNQAYCEADSKGVAQNSKESVDTNKRLGCFWDGSTCGTRVISSYGGADIGNCSYIEDTSSDPDKCDNNFLTYTWTAVWNWAFPLNYYNSLNDCELDNTPGTCVEDPDISGRFYYDPIGARSDCQNGEATISCPAKVALDFFSLKNLFAAIILIVAIYLIMDRYKKPTKKKSTKKKVVKKKK